MFWQLVPPDGRREERSFVDGGAEEWDPVPMLVSESPVWLLPVWLNWGRQLNGDKECTTRYIMVALAPESPSLTEGFPF